MMAPFYLLYRTGFAPTNGTSVQLRRLLAGRERAIVHLLWDVEEAGVVSVPYSVVVDDSRGPQWPLPRGKTLYSNLRKWLQLGWWAGDRLGKQKLDRYLQRIPLRPNCAYIICMREWDARRAYALWQGLGCPPYVLHVMDIFHDELNDRETPRFAELVRGAQCVICISDLIEAEVRRCGASRTAVLPCCSDFSPGDRVQLEDSLRVVIIGTIWNFQYSKNPALEVLGAAWPTIVDRFPRAELHYAGNSGNILPPALRARMIDHGQLDSAECERLLRQSHVAYLPVSHPVTTVARFSLPSRLADYLACGLPTITCTDEGTGIASFMRSAPRSCAANITNVEDLVGTISNFANDPIFWARASAEAAVFAHEKLSTERVRMRLLTILDSLAQPNGHIAGAKSCGAQLVNYAP